MFTDDSFGSVCYIVLFDMTEKRNLVSTSRCILLALANGLLVYLRIDDGSNILASKISMIVELPVVSLSRFVDDLVR